VPLLKPTSLPPVLEQKHAHRRIGLWLVLTLAVVLRLIDLGTVPPTFSTADEFHHLWCGLSLLNGDRATSWSNLPGYAGGPAEIGKVPIELVHRLVGLPPPTEEQPRLGWLLRGSKPEPPPGPMMLMRPALDHPPLYSLVAGGFARLTGARAVETTTDRGQHVRLWGVNLGRARLLSILLHTFAMLLLYDLAARRCGHAVALLAVALLACNSHAILHNRLLVTESLSLPLFLGNLCAWERFRTRRWGEVRFAMVTMLCCAAALLTKLIAVSQAPAMLMLLLWAGKRRAALYPIFGVALGLAIYLTYAASQGWGVFLDILHNQASRFDGFSSLREFITKPQLIELNSFNMVLFAGWFAFFGLLLTSRHRVRPLLAASAVYLLSFSYFSAAHQMFGWHAQPFYPFLVLAFAVVFMRVAWRPEPLAYAALLLLLLPAAFDFLSYLQGNLALIRSAFLLVVAAALLLPSLLPRRAALLFQRGLLGAALVTLVLHQLWGIWVLSQV
jgi:hypothetical protein